MSEDVARAIGTPGTATIIIAGKECRARPLSLRELGLVERECLNQYRENRLEYLSRTTKYLPEGEATKIIREKILEMESWDVKSLPMQKVYDPDRLYVNEKLTQWVFDNVSGSADEYAAHAAGPAQRRLIQKWLAASLDGQMLTEDEFKEMCGHAPVSMKTGYVNWWITGCFSGMLEIAYQCFAHHGVTREQVSEAFIENFGMLIGLSRQIEKLSAPQSGNT